MKIKTGQESYESDENSVIKTLQADWWHDLSEKIRHESIEISHKVSRLLAFTLKALDWIIRTLALSGTHYFLIRKNKAEILEQRQQWGFYHELATKHDALQVFKQGPPINAEEVQSQQKKQLSDGRIVSGSAPSKFEALNPYFSERYWDYHKHRQIHFELWQHDGPPRPTYLFMHGYNADAYSINHVIFSAKKLYQDGFNICFMILPFHNGKLSLKTDVWNFFGHGPAYTIEVFAHAVANCRSMITYLQEQNIASHIGIGGISLGAFVSSLALSVDTRIKSAILVAPVYNAPDIFMDWFPLRGLFDKLLKEENISFSEFRQSYALCNALTFQPAIDTHKIVILSGTFDLIAMPKHVRLLGEHWQQCDIFWLDYSHVGMTRPDPFYQEIKEHIEKVAMSGEQIETLTKVEMPIHKQAS